MVADLIVFEAVALGEPGHIEPVPAPPLAVVRRGQQPVDQAFVGRWAKRSARKASISVGRRRESQQVERHAADQGERSAGGAGARPAAPSRARMKASIGLARPGRRLHRSAARAGPAAQSAQRPAWAGDVRVSGDRSSHRAPASTQARTSATWSGPSGASGASSPRRPCDRRGSWRRHAARSAAPDSPPRSAACRVVRSRPPAGSSPPWHSTQRVRIGCIPSRQRFVRRSDRPPPRRRPCRRPSRQQDRRA